MPADQSHRASRQYHEARAGLLVCGYDIDAVGPERAPLGYPKLPIGSGETHATILCRLHGESGKIAALECTQKPINCILPRLGSRVIAGNCDLHFIFGQLGDKGIPEKRPDHFLHLRR
jgi:hypothetical protein